MRLRDIIALLDGQLLTEKPVPDVDLHTACAADLMSDVLSFAEPGSLLLTGLINPQVIRTAEMVDAAAVVLVRGKQGPPATIALATEKDIPILSSPYTLFECCGRLYSAGLEACDVRGEARARTMRRLGEYGRAVSPEGSIANHT